MFFAKKISGGGSIAKGRAEATPLHNLGLQEFEPNDHSPHEHAPRNHRGIEERPAAAKPAMNCDWIAPFYRTAEHVSFGGKLEACRAAFVGELKDCRQALLCGDGDGRFLVELLRTNRMVRVDCVDLSSEMIELARRRVARLGVEFLQRVRFFAGDLRDVTANERSYDLIGAHFFLDCFDDAGVAGIAERFANWAEPGARLVLSEFRRPARGISRLLGGAMIRGLYAAFRATTGLRVTRLPEYEQALAHAGFVEERRTARVGGLLQSAIWRRSG
jgi:SAM-dependent methyltransferase